MKEHLAELLGASFDALAADGKLERDVIPESIAIETARDPKHGDFASNVALVAAKAAGMKPRDLAQLLIDHLPASGQVTAAEIAGPGFINFRVSDDVYRQLLADILADGERYACAPANSSGQKILLEYVSANPTGPLHVGHGRLAAYGATLGNLLQTQGHEVHREYYVNDAGRQMQILAASVWLRYLEQRGEALPFPANGYRGDYILAIATALGEAHGDALRHPAADVLAGLPPDEADGGDKERYIDALIDRARQLLGADTFQDVLSLALEHILGDIRDDLGEFGVHFDEWFSEKRLMEEELVEHALEKLQGSGQVVERDGALWFLATAYGDDKDRVVRRDNGVTTYFASDIAYHLNKRERGYDVLLDVLGADHHGYVSRVRAGLEAMGEPPQSLEVQLVQFVALYRGKVKQQMSTRSGQFVTLRDLRNEVGDDAARFFYVSRGNDQHLDFDLDLARERSNENPVYYLQYAHARVCSMARKAEETGHAYTVEEGLKQTQALREPAEQAIMRTLERYPEILRAAADKRAPQLLVHYLRELANEFHSYYNAHKVLVDDDAVRNARLTLSHAARQVIANGLGLLGVQAPQSM
ncbi:MAG: arginine--tRNA ligase [Pseudomonadota bacterium]